MLELHILASRKLKSSAQAIKADGCNHADWLSTDGDAIRCCKCLSHLVMVPFAPGEFRLEWIAPTQSREHTFSRAA